MEISALLQNGSQKVVIPAHESCVEHRRVIGPMRERTIFIQTKFPNQFTNTPQYPGLSPQIRKNRTIAPQCDSNKHIKNDEDDNFDLSSYVSRISRHLDKILVSQQCSLDEKLYDIENQAEKAQQLQEEVEARLITIKKILKQKRRSQQSQTPQMTLTHSQLPRAPPRISQTPDISSKCRFNFFDLN